MVMVMVVAAEPERRLGAGQHGFVRVVQEMLVAEQMVRGGRVGRGQRVAQRRVVRLRRVVGHLRVHACEQKDGRAQPRLLYD